MNPTQQDPQTKSTGYLFRGALFAVFALVLTTLPVSAQEPLRILATGVFATTLHALAEPFEKATGTKLEISIANAGQVAARITAGEPTDLVMSSSASIQTLTTQGVLVPRDVAVGKMRLGVAVRAGVPAPDLTSPEAFRAALLSAAKVAYIDPTGGGTSGPFFEKMFTTMGITEAVHAKALLGKDGAAIVQAVASGSAAVGMTQASEIIGAAGVTFAGYVPASLNLTTPYAAAVAAQAKNPKAAAAFLEFIAGPVGSSRLRQSGWDLEK